MMAAPSRTCGAVSPTRTPRCSSGAFLLSLLLAATALPAAADIDPNRLIFEPAPRGTVNVAAGIAAPLAPPAAAAGNLAQPAPAETLANIAALNQRIADLLEQQGGFTPQLIQEYMDLGRRYQQLGRHDEAIEALEDAEHLSRVTSGLANPELIRIVEASLPSHLARGDLQDIARKQQLLYELTRSNFGSGSRELDPLLLNLAEWQLRSFSHGLRRQPVISIGGRSIDPRQMAFGNLYRAQRFYAEAIGNRLQRLDLQTPGLLELERQFVQTQYLAAMRNGLLDNPDFFVDQRGAPTGSRLRRSLAQGHTPQFVNGRNAYTRMHFYAQRLQLPPLERARLIVEEADWHLLFGHHGRALDIYARARELLQAAGAAAGESAALLQSPQPPQLPTFMGLPHSLEHFGLGADDGVQWQGWVDVSFELSRYGNVRRLRIDASSEGTDRVVERRLRRLLQSNPFRPFIALGDDAEAPRYTLRYHYAMAPPQAHGPALVQR